MSTPFVPLQLQLPGDEHRDRPGRYRPARCGNPNPAGCLLIGWGSWSQHTARVASQNNVAVQPNPGRTGSHPRIKNPSIPLQLQLPGDENADPPGRPPRRVYWLRLMDPGRGESCPSGQRRDPAEPGEDKFPSPDHKLLHISTTSTTRDENADSPGRYRPARCGNPNPSGWLLIG